jgi:carboxyl-terminal processing protease
MSFEIIAEMIKGFLKKSLTAGSAFLIALAVFFVGFFIGQEGFGTIISGNNSVKVDATTDADFDPFWKAWDVIDEKYIPASTTIQVSEQERVWGAISGMVDALDDPYTTFLKPKENERFETTIRGEFSGVGMEVDMKEDAVVVVSPLKDSPAERAGLEPGDKVLAVDGESIVGNTLDEAIDLIRGPLGTTVTLTISREGVDLFDVDIVREIINIPTLKTEIVNDDIFMISLYNFSGNSPDQFRDALRDFILSRKSKMILDLRGNPGGYLEAAVDVASWYLPAGKVIVREDFGDNDREEKVFRSKGYNIFGDNIEIVILVNQGSASASEIVAGALQEHGVATLVGDTTFGKGSVQELIQITPETSLKVTVARWLTPDGTSISAGGLTPDVIVNSETHADQISEEVTVSDLQLQKAIEILMQ